MRDVRRALAALVLLIAACLPVAADDVERTTTVSLAGVYYFGYKEGYDIDGRFAPPSCEVVAKEELAHDPDDPGRDLGYWGSMGFVARIVHSIRRPFLVGSGPLLEGNALQLDLSCELTPITISAAAEAVLTPAAVVRIAAGASAGTGWSLGASNGLGRNLPGLEHEEIEQEPLSGVVLSGWLSTTFQFDLATLWPGEWHHIVVAAGPRLEYRAFTNADSGTAWEWQADHGENLNGWRLATSAFVGYRMPVRVDTAGLLVSTVQYLGRVRDRSPMDDAGGWGSDFVRVTIAPMAALALSERARFTTVLQLETAPDYTDGTIGNRYFELRDYDGWYLYVRRLVVSLGWRL